MPSVRRSLHPQRFILAKMVTFWKKKQRTVRCWRSTTRSLQRQTFWRLKIWKKTDSRLQRSRQSIIRIQALKKQLIICSSKLTELSAKGLTSWSFQIEEWMNIMWQCRHFWYFPDCSSIWYVRRNVRLWGLFWRRENQEKYIILRHWSVMVHVRSTRILHMNPSNSLLIPICFRKTIMRQLMIITMQCWEEL